MVGSVELKKVIITGPTGAVGTALIDELVSCGIEVVAVCREGSSRLDAIPRHDLVRVVECSLGHYSRLKDILAECAPFDAFYHFAWDGTYGPSRLDWHRQEANIRDSIDAVYAAHDLGCKVFIGAGSQSEMGHVEGVLHPDAPCNPDNGYGAAKLADCVITKALCGSLGIRHEWCRIVSLYGPRDGAHTLIMTCINALLNGEHLSCTHGDQVWDYIYSKDAARAFRLVAEKGRHGEVYMLGTGNTRPLREFIEAIRDEIDPRAEIGFGERDYYPNQVMHLEADISNLTDRTGFIPQYTFEQGISETIEWARKSIGSTATRKGTENEQHRLQDA